MATKQEVESFLNDFKTKMSIFPILFMDNRGKNAQALLDFEISPIKRIEILKKLDVEDYSQGPIEENMHGLRPMLVFGKDVKGTEAYIKISMGIANTPAICISFHPAEHSIKYPYKTTKQ